jgi:hypothetical protein
MQRYANTCREYFYLNLATKNSHGKLREFAFFLAFGLTSACTSKGRQQKTWLQRCELRKWCMEDSLWLQCIQSSKGRQGP